MPAVISHTCPYCFHENIVFSVVAESMMSKAGATARIFQTLATCGKCDKGAVATFRVVGGASTPMNHVGDYSTSSMGNTPPLELLDFQPKYRPKEPPKHLPAHIHQALQQASDNFDRDQFTPAVIMVRKTIELALASAFPDVSGKLAKQIYFLGKDNIIPRTMVDWVDEIRLLGNEGAHDDMLDDECAETAASVKQALAFADMFLTYVFTMPEEVRLRREGKA